MEDHGCFMSDAGLYYRLGLVGLGLVWHGMAWHGVGLGVACGYIRIVQNKAKQNKIWGKNSNQSSSILSGGFIRCLTCAIYTSHCCQCRCILVNNNGNVTS